MENKTNAKAITSLILGILSLLTLFFGYGAIIGIVISIVGIVLAVSAKKEMQVDGSIGTGLATAGLACSIISLSLCALGVLCVIACVGTFATIGAMG